MRKIEPYLVVIIAGFLLLIAGACNLPGFLEGNSGTPKALTGPSNTDGAETILIPGGTFWMGSQDTDTLASTDEIPRHQVSLASFYLYTHEVTNKMYAACVEAGTCLPVNVMDSGPTTHFSDPTYSEYPVVGVDWKMARDYCTWAGGRLPTEAEWEYAARGTDSLLYPWGGEAPACDRVNMLGCAVPPDTVKIGSYALGNSPFEVWDMAGNVWEWVNDWYAEGYYGLSPATNPPGPYSYQDANNPLKVVRGGGLYSGPEQMRSGDRAGTNPYRAYDDVGFRCVAAGETLTPGYTTPSDRHEMVPPDPLDGGGEPLDGPDESTPWFSMGWSDVSCPSPEGRMHLVVEADSSEATTYSVTVEEIPFECTYDEMLRLLQCEGPVPETTEYPDEYHVKIHFLPHGGIGHAYPEKPTDCEDLRQYVLNITATAACPESEWITVSILSNTTVVWEQVESLGESLACWQVSDTQTNCLLHMDPEDPARIAYPIHAHGQLPDGFTFGADLIANIPEGCALVPRGTNVTPFCFENQPAVHVAFVPTGSVLSSASTLGVPLNCIGMTPNDQFCGVLPGAPGSATTVTTCFEGETCEGWPITVPDCSGVATGYINNVSSTCYETLGPVVVINYGPADQPLVTANANGLDLTCYDAAEPGWYMCSGIPGTPGTEMTISFCLADGTCFSEPITVSDCGVATWSEDWRLIAVECADETNISFMIDTSLDWLVPGADFTYSATDEEVTYSCSIHATVAGRIYCAGTRPEGPGDLQFCLQRPGDAAPTCTTFPEYEIWLNETPPCAQIPAEPVEPHAPVCADYTSESACNAQWAMGCKWYPVPAPGVCK